jgi:hypothetical protein
VHFFEAVVDTAATANFCYEKELFRDYVRFDKPLKVFVTPTKWVFAMGRGIVGILPYMFVPSFKRNLMSVSAMAALGITIDLHHGGYIRGLGFYGKVFQKSADGLLYVNYEVLKPTWPKGVSRANVESISIPNDWREHHECITNALVADRPPQSVRFIVDSGATHTLVNTLRGVVLDPLLGSARVELADGTIMEAAGVGIFEKGSSDEMEVVYVPDLGHNLLSVAAMSRLGYSAPEFGYQGCSFARGFARLDVLQVHRSMQLYYADLPFRGTDIGFPENMDKEIIPAEFSGEFCASTRVTLSKPKPVTKHVVCTNCGGSTHAVENCWSLHPNKRMAHLAGRLAAREDEKALDIPLYHVAVGTLQWLAGTTHPEIGYSVEQCYKCSRAPTTANVRDVIQLLTYCQGDWAPRRVGLGALSSVQMEHQAISLVGLQVLRLMNEAEAAHLLAGGPEQLSATTIKSDNQGAVEKHQVSEMCYK